MKTYNLKEIVSCLGDAYHGTDAKDMDSKYNELYNEILDFKKHLIRREQSRAKLNFGGKNVEKNTYKDKT